ncbi:MAG: hypothetical protein QW589_07790 [Candidatus Bathyarchaeia archaeon]
MVRLKLINTSCSEEIERTNTFIVEDNSPYGVLQITELCYGMN